MTSANSSNNMQISQQTPNGKFVGKPSNKLSLGSIMKSDVRHRIWMIAFSILGNLITGPVLFLFSLDLSQGELTVYNLRSFLYDGGLISFTLSLGLAVILANYGFRHLFSGKMTDLVHSLPVNRDRYFLAVWLDSFLIWLLPFLAGELCIYAIALFRLNSFHRGIVALFLLKQILLGVFGFLIAYNACLVAVMISGNALNSLANTVLYGLTVLLAYCIFFGYASICFDTFYSYDFLSKSWEFILSPLADPVYLYYSMIDSWRRLTSSQSVFSIFCSIFLPRLLLLVFNFGLAMYLHRKRPSELAGHGLENRFFRIPLRFAASVLAGLLLSLMIDVLFDGKASTGWLLFGALLGCSLAFAMMNIIYHAAFDAFLRHKGQLAAAALCACLITIAFRFDLFPYDRYIADRDSITGLALQCEDFFEPYSWYFYRNQAGYLEYNRADFAPKLVFTDKDKNYELLSALVDGHEQIRRRIKDGEPLPGAGAITVKVDTRHGSYYRAYRSYDVETVREALRPFVEDASYRNAYYPISSGRLGTPREIQLESLSGQKISLGEDDPLMQELLAAYCQDFSEHYSMETVSTNGSLLTLKAFYPLAGDSNYTAISLQVPPDYTGTISLLKKWYPEDLWEQADFSLRSMQINLWTNSPDREELYRRYAPENVVGASGTELKIIQEEEPKYVWKREINDPEELLALDGHLVFWCRIYLTAFGGDDTPIGTAIAVPKGMENDENASEHSFVGVVSRDWITKEFLDSLTPEALPENQVTYNQ